jgi:hypothetical protein
MTTFKSKSKQTDLSPQDLPTIPTVQEMTTWDEAALLQWIQQENPKLLRREYLDKFTAAGFLGETFLLPRALINNNTTMPFHVTNILSSTVFSMTLPYNCIPFKAILNLFKNISRDSIPTILVQTSASHSQN